MGANRLAVRTSPRQAIVASFEPVHAPWAERYVLPLALDLVEAMVGVNGATLMFGCGSSYNAQTLAATLPAGIDILTLPAIATPESPEHWFARQITGLGFERLLIVSADVIGVSARLLSTALSLLASEETVFGATPSGKAYLAGIQANALLANAFHVRTLLAEFSAGQEPAIAGRRLEQRRRLRECSSKDEFLRQANQNAKLLPRTLAVR